MSTNAAPSLWVGAAVAGATTVATIAIGYRILQNWQSSASTTDVSSRSTTSSAGGGPEAYETKKAVDEYLQFHFPVSEELMPYDKGPKDAVHFTQNCALLCERHCPALQDFSGDEQDVGTTALDIGCAVGGAVFELARSFQHVMGIDYSSEFIKAAETMKTDGRMPYEAVVEGTLTESYVASVDEGIDREKVRFMVGDACNLRSDLREVDCVLAANLLCRLPDPMKFLARLPSLVKKGGIAVLVSPYSWLPGWTPKDKWLGGFAGRDGQPVRSKEALRAVMEELGFVLAHEEDMPFLIREHARKFQWGCSHATVWAKQ